MQPEKELEKEMQPLGARTKEAVAGEREEISRHADVVLTGGHGGAVPPFIVWITKKIFRKSEDS